VSSLTENMRVLAHGNDQRLQEFDTFLLSLGDGTRATLAEDSDLVQLPAELCITIDKTDLSTIQTSMQSLIRWVFPDIETNFLNWQWLATRGVFCPKNAQVDEVNEMCATMIPGEETVLSSADSAVHPEQMGVFGPELLNTLSANGMPAHRIIVKPGMPLMLLRNLSKRDGLCNGTRLIFKEKVGQQLLKCVVASGDGAGREVLIPRIKLRPSDNRGQPCEWQRVQFPVRVAFAMSINKGQGQTMLRAGIWLEEGVFGHGQLYVAASRVGSPDAIRFAVPAAAGLPGAGQVAAHVTKNVVYRELLRAAAAPLLN